MAKKKKRPAFSERQYFLGPGYAKYLEGQKAQEEIIKRRGNVSQPSYNPDDVANALDEQDEPFYERWFNSAKDFGSELLDSVTNTSIDDVLNSGRMTFGRIIDGLVDNKIADVDEITQNKIALEKVQQFKELNEQLNQKRRQLDVLQNYQENGGSGWNVVSNYDIDRLNGDVAQIQQQLDGLNEYFLGDGRSNEIVQKYMYNNDNLSTWQKWYLEGARLQEGLKWPNLLDYNPFDADNATSVYKYGPFSIYASAFRYGADTAEQLMRGAGNTISYATEKLIHPFSGEDYLFKKTLSSLDPNIPEEFHIIRDSYIGNKGKSALDGISLSNITSDAANMDRQLREKTAALEARIEFAKDGKISQLLKGFGVNADLGALDADIYDPEDVPDQFKEDQQKYSKGKFSWLTHPLYTFPETGSTFSMMGYQVAAMGWDGLVGWAAKKLPTWSSPYLKATAIAGGVGSAILSRQDETNLEKIEALSERALEKTIAGGGDYEKIFTAIKEQAAKLGIDTTGFDEQKLFKLGLAYNMETEDPAFERAKKEARYGINKLVNANNALAFMDYVDMLPFMNYAGKALNRAARKEAAMFVNPYARQGLGTTEDLVAKGILNGKFVKNGGRDVVAELNESGIRAIFDAAIDKAATKLVKKNLPSLALHGKEVLKTLGHLGGNMAFHSALESVEEGQQHLLQSRFKRGEYDNYNKPESLLNIPEVFDNAYLANEAVLDYFGLRPWDPDNGSSQLQEAMNVGFSASLMSSPIMQAISEGFHYNDGQIKQFIQQWKDDSQVVKFVGERFSDLEDYGRLQFFFDAFNKAGATRQGMSESLQFVKNAVDEQNTLVKKEDVENDIDLMNAVWYMYHENNEFNKALDDRKIYRGGAFHREAVIQGAKHIVDTNRTQKLVDNLENSIGKSEQEREAFVDKIFDEFISEEDKQRLIEQDRELANSVNVFRQQYNKYKEATRKNNNRKLQKWVAEHQDEQFFFNNEDIKEFAEERGFSLHDLYNNESRRDRALSHAYQKEQDRNWYSQFDVDITPDNRDIVLQTFNRFVNNVYIKRALKDAYNYTTGFEEFAFNVFKDNSAKQEFLDKAYKMRNGGTLSEKDYVLDRLNGLQLFRTRQAIQQAYDVVNNQAEFLKYLREEFGYDINPEKLKGIAKGMKKMLANIKKQEDTILNGDENSRDKNNPVYTFEDVYKDMDVHLGNEAEIMKMSQALAINKEILSAQKVLKNIYQDLSVSPNNAKDAIFGESSEGTYLDEIAQQFDEKIHQMQTKDRLDMHPGEEKLDIEDLNKMKRDAAWKIIDSEMRDREERKWIARRRLIEDQAVTPAIAEEMEKEAESEQEKQKAPETTPAVEKEDRLHDDRTEAEKQLAKRYANEPQKTGIEKAKKAKERAEKAKAKKDLSTRDQNTANDIDRIEEGSKQVPVKDDTDSSGWAEPNWVSTLSQLNDGQVVAISETNDDSQHYIRVTKDESKDGDGNTVQDIKLEEVVIEEDGEIKPVDSVITIPPAPEEYEAQQSTNDVDINQVKIVMVEGKPTHIIAPGVVYSQPELVEESSPDVEDGEGVQAEEAVIEDSIDEENNDVAIDEEYADVSEEEEDLQPDVDEFDNDIEIDESEIEIEDESLLGRNESGRLTYDGEVLPSHVEEEIEVELELLSQSEEVGFDQNIMPQTSKDKEEEKEADAKYETVGRLYSRTFFYDPQAETTIDLKVGDKEVKLPKPLGTGKQLAEKLAQHGWIEKTKQYYIVTQPTANTKIAENTDLRDSMTVCLVIEDDEHCYVTTLRALGIIESDVANDKNSKYQIHAEKKLRNKLQIRGANWDLIEAETGRTKPLKYSSQAELYKETVENYAKNLCRDWYKSEHEGSDRGFDDWWKHGPRKNQFAKSEDEAYNDAKDEWSIQRNKFFSVARKHYALPTARILSYEQIDNEIKRLRANRNEIIDAYLRKDAKGNYVFPEEVRTDVLPARLNQSNGKINNQLEYKTIVQEDLSIDQITSKLESGELLLGFGRGRYGLNKNYIDLLSDSQVTLSEHGGLSGKIYMFIEGLSPLSKQKVPIMLAEEKFNTQVKVQKSGNKTIFIRDKYVKQKDGKMAPSIVECLQYDNSTGTIKVINDSYLPTAAEVLFYMLTGKYNFGTYDIDQQNEILEFFLHTGEKTLLKNQPKVQNDPLSFLAQKQISVSVQNGARILSIAIQNQDGVYELKNYTDVDLFNGDPEVCAQNRLDIIHAISTQMHWNTDVTHMNSTVNAYQNTKNAMSGFIAGLFSGVKTETNEEFLEQEVSIFGCPQLTFKAKDFYEIKNGKIVSKDVNITAWMIKNGKLKSNLADSPFKDPFVFANGVKQNQTRSEKQFQKKAEKENVPDANVVNTTGEQVRKKKNVPAGFTIYDEQKRSEFLEWVGPKLPRWERKGGFKIASTEEERKQIRAEIDETRGAKDNGGIRDRFIIRFPKDKINNQDDAIAYVKQQISDLIKTYDSKLSPKVDLQELTKTQLFQACSRRSGIIVLDIYKNGKLNCFVDMTQTMTSGTKRYSGVFSRHKGRGKLDSKAARKWLSEKLGLRDNQIAITAAMRSMQDDEIFGLTNVVFDRIYNQMVGFIMVDEGEGEGIQYHEAWHYVNLLVHNRQEREELYNAYYEANKKKKYKDAVPSYEEIEEDMADDFQNWMEDQIDPSWKGKISRFFQSVFQLLLASRRKAAYYRVFRKIKNGGYSDAKLDQQSVREFHRKYENGVPKKLEYISGVRRKDLKNLEHITTYQDFFNITEAIIRRLYVELDLTTMDKIQEYGNNQKRFKDTVIPVVDKMINEQSNPRIEEQLLDIKNNPAILRYALLESFQDLGITVKIKKDNGEKKESAQEVSNSTEARENNTDFSWDIFELTQSKKDNAGLRTKLFLKQLPVYERDVETGDIVIAGVDEFGTQKMYDFDEAWNKIIELWQVRSYGDIDPSTGEYKKSSLLGMLQQQAKSDPFYQSVFDKLQDLEDVGEYGDVSLKSQIYTTICSYKTPVAYLQLQDPSVQFVSDDYEDYIDDSSLDIEVDSNVVADRMREWVLMDDSNLQAIRSIPRRWSQKLAQNGLIDFDKKSGKTVVSSTFAKKVEKAYVSLKAKANLNSSQYKKKHNSQLTSKPASEVKDEIISDFINMLNMMGMPVDIPTLNVFISAQSTQRNNRELSDQEIIDTINAEINRGSIGSIGAFVKQISSSAGKSEIQKLDRTIYGRDLDELYKNCVYDKEKNYTQITKLALAYNAVHPSPADYKIKGPNGEMYFPINENNTLTSDIRDLNDRESGKSEDLRRSSYCGHSVVLDAADSVNELDPDTKLQLKTFVGLKDANRVKGSDYFQITPMEDYLMKLFITEHNGLTLPTMADKKTWYALFSKNIKLFHDTMLCAPIKQDIDKYIYIEYEKIYPFEESEYFDQPRGRSTWKYKANVWYDLLDDQNETKIWIKQQASQDLIESGDRSVGFGLDDNGVITPQFGDNVISTFCGYFMDELQSLIDYYDRNVIKELVKDPNRRKTNFHGKVENGRMDFSGNGGKFRYFYDVFTFTQKKGDPYNLNQKLEALYKLQQQIESGKIVGAPTEFEKYITRSSIRENGKELDGFELIREYLKDLKSQVKAGNVENAYSNDLKKAVNKKLVSQTYAELDRISQENSPIQLAKYDSYTGMYIPTAVPQAMLKRYMDALQKSGHARGNFGGPYDGSATDVAQHALFSLIANHVANTAVSVIELEKVFTGDPACYKYSDNKTEGEETQTINIEYVTKDGKTAKAKVEVSNVSDIFGDKIKRLGGFLSPGQEQRLSYTDQELEYDKYLSEKNKPELYMPLSGSKYTNLNVEDVEVPSLFLHEQRQMFKTALVVGIIRNEANSKFDSIFNDINKNRAKENKNPLTKEQVISILYSRYDYIEQIYKSLSKDKKKTIDTQLEQQMAPYKNINVCDAQVFIRPALYRKIRIGLGEWSIDPDETGYSDEIAYEILETDASWMSDPEKAKIVSKFQAYVLKMSYSENEMYTVAGKHFNWPLYNKMAMFPLFKFHASTNVGNALYDRMNKAGNELDMISFKSAVKVGGIQNGVKLTTISKKDAIKKIQNQKNDPEYVPTEDEIFDAMDIQGAISQLSDAINADSNQHIEYGKDRIIPNKSKNTIGVTIQDLHNLRMQLNTKAHEDEVRAIGTQMFKIAFENIIDNADYGTRKEGRSARKGWEIKRDIMRCIDKLTTLGEQELREKFYKNVISTDKDGKQVVHNVLDEEKVQKFIKHIINSNGLGSAAEEIIANGGVAAGLMSRRVFENSTSSDVNRKVVNVNTQGGTAIQQSVYGFVGLSNKTVANQDEANYFAYNNGKELQWSAKEGSMEVLLSMNFFKAVLPADYKDKPFKEQRKWLIEHDIIKGVKKDGTKSNPKPFGIGYRIPTQGMSSMFSFIVADVIPAQCGDLIVVPREFTAQTGSDFDIDKLFIATMAYKDGMLQEDDETAAGLGNRLLLNYIDIISDVKNYADARGSIDVITKKLKSELINPILKEYQRGYLIGMTPLMPSFQALRKMEFSTGKSGIGPYALNITNLALTQAMHLDMNIDKDVRDAYGFGHLDDITGRDGILISSWLSAMVNAHVDVAKDPYIFDLNINQFTYNHSALLLRLGMGMSTFTFLAQPILKIYAQQMNNVGGVYGGSVDGSNQESKAFSGKRKMFYKNNIAEYLKILKSIKDTNGDQLSEQDIKALDNAIVYFEDRFKPKDDRRKSTRTYSKSQIFDEESAKEAIRNNNSSDPEKRMYSLIYQMHAIETFVELQDYAQALSDMVQCSQIDTKKFGNNVASQINFKNNYYKLRYSSKLWTINQPGFENQFTSADGKIDNEAMSKAALTKYFTESFLDKKLRKACDYTARIMSEQLFTCTNAFNSIFRTVCGSFFGYTKLVIDESKDEFYNAYNKIYKDEVVQSISMAIDNVMRFNSLMSYGYTVYDKEKKKHSNTRMIDFTLGGDKQAVINNVKRLLFGTDTEKSIFDRLSTLMDDIRENPYDEKYDDLVDDRGDIINDLLLYLDPQSPNSKYPIGRMFLSTSSIDTNKNTKRRLITAFDQLLRSEDEDIRKLATDLAFYAYYSTYDQNVINGFFDLVPVEYRKQYDLCLGKTLRGLNSPHDDVYAQTLQEVLGVSGLSDIDEILSLGCGNVIDVISRNFWYDDNIIVPTYIPTYRSSFYSKNAMIVGDPQFDQESKKAFPTWIAANNIPNSPYYIKIRKGQAAYIYKKVGKIERYMEGKDDNGNAKKTDSSSFDVYIAVQKAGLHKGKINQYELYADSNTLSVFDDNKLPTTKFSETVVRESVEKRLGQDKKNKSQKDLDYQFTIEWASPEVPAIFSEESDLYAAKSSSNYDIGNTYVMDTDKAEETAQKMADVIINIVNDETKDIRGHISYGSKEKVVDFNIDGNISEAISKVKDIVGTKEARIHITTAIYDGKFPVNEDAVKKYIEDALSEFEARNSADISPEDLQQELANMREKLEKPGVADNVVKQSMFNDRLFEIINGLAISEVNLKNLSAAVNKSHTRIAKSVSQISRNNKTLFEFPAWIYLERSYVSGKENKWRLKYLLDDLSQDAESVFVDDTVVEDEISGTVQDEQIEAKRIIDENIPQNNKQFTYARMHQNSYEVSSRGDSRFSAMVAKFKPGTVLFGHDVGGRTIESVYQHGVKQGDWTTNNNSKTGKPNSKDIITGNTENDSYVQGYLPLWKEWAKQNPELIQELMQKARGKVLTDQFASTAVSQARALADILNQPYEDQQTKQQIENKTLAESNDSEQNKQCAGGQAETTPSPRKRRLGAAAANSLDD